MKPSDFRIFCSSAISTFGRSVPFFTATLTAGDVFIAFPNQEHGYVDTENIQGYVMIIPTQPYLTAFRSAFEQSIPANPVLRKGQWEHTGILPLMDAAIAEWHTGSKALLHGYALLIVSKLMPLLQLRALPAGQASSLQELLMYINTHYTEPLSRQEIARAVGYSESYISHIFTQQLNTSLSDYISSLRINDAKQFLTETDMTISQISAQLGFGCIRSFNRAFFKETGLTPTDYRNTST